MESSNRILIVTKATILIVSCFLLSNVSGSCLSYGHSCWGAHGKRNGDSTNHNHHHHAGTMGGAASGSTHWFLSKLAATNPLQQLAAEPSVDSQSNDIRGLWRNKLQRNGSPMFSNDDNKYIGGGNGGSGGSGGGGGGDGNNGSGNSAGVSGGDDDDKSITPLVASSTWNAFDPTDTLDYISNPDQTDDERMMQLNPETDNIDDLYIISRQMFPTKKQLKRPSSRVMKFLENGGRNFMNLD